MNPAEVQWIYLDVDGPWRKAPPAQCGWEWVAVNPRPTAVLDSLGALPGGLGMDWTPWWAGQDLG